MSKSNSQPASTLAPEDDYVLFPPVFSQIPFRHAYGPKLRSALAFTGPGRTHQSFKDDCDINIIMSRYQQTGVIEHLAKRPPMWGDVPNLDFHQAMGLLIEAREKFDSLPSAVRERFGNDPLKMVDFLKDAANRQEAEKLGLLTPREPARGAPDTPAATPLASNPSNAA